MTKMTGARAIAELLHGYGVTHVFMVPAVLRRTMAEMERRTTIRAIHTHGEKSAVYMADGYARASGRPGICMAQQVGALNLAAGVREAWLARSPVIAITGGNRPDHRFRGTYQDANDFPAFEPYTKWNAAIDHVERIPDSLRQAFRVATSANPGPVHLQIQGQEGELDRQEGDFDLTFDTEYRRVPPFRPLPDPGRIEAALERIGRAERPVIVAGGGCRLSGAADQLRAFAEAAAIPVVISLNGRSAFPDAHPLCAGVVGTYSRPPANQTLHDADLAILVGTAAGSLVTNFWRLPRPGTAVVQIDIDPAAIGRNYPAEVAIQADAREALAALTAGLQGLGAVERTGWLQTLGERVDAWKQERSSQVASDNRPVRPERLCGEISDWLPDDAVLCVDTGHAGMWMASMFDLRAPSQTFIRSAGHLGWAFPAGIGAKSAQPDRPVVAFTGDLGMWYHIAEIETAVRSGVNSITVVNNNHSGNQSRRGFSIAYDGKPTARSQELWVHRAVDFARIGEEIGALGLRVEDPADLRPALDRALVAKRPVVIDVATDIDAAAPLPWDGEGWTQRY